MGTMRINPKKIVRTLRTLEGKVRATARKLQISPGTVINWRRRAAQLSSLHYLERNSTRPHAQRGVVLSASDQKRIRTIREATRYGAIKIQRILKLASHHATVHRFLKDRNFIPEGISYRRPRYQPTIHMYVKNAIAPGKLQMDVKYVTPELSGLPHTCFLYALMDIFSRFKQGIMFPLLDQGFAIEALKYILPLLPLTPDFIQTDNGLEFQKRFDGFVKRIGWQHHYIHKSSPNENAVIERSFRTDEEEFFFFRMKRPRSLADLNMQYQLYLHEYNTERPHLSLNMMTPFEKLKSVQNV